MRDEAIGVFDSGVGGLTVVQRILEALPREKILYLGDTGRYPYGNKSPEMVTRYSLENVDFLVERGVKLLVVACNSASAMSLDAIRSRHPHPVVGVIEPGARAAVEGSRNRRIGVIGTEATIASGAYTRALRRLDPDVQIFSRACPLFVPLAEEGWVDNPVTAATVPLYLESLKASGVDTVILGCTHYPLLRRAIARFLGRRVTLVDSAEETAREVRQILEGRDGIRRKGRGAASFFVTDVPDRFVRVGRRFLGERVESAVRIEP